MVQIELFGVPRLRARRSDLAVVARSMAEALRELEQCCPELAPSVVSGGRLAPSYLVALNGKVVEDSPDTVLNDGDMLLIMSAQAGG